MRPIQHLVTKAAVPVLSVALAACGGEQAPAPKPEPAPKPAPKLEERVEPAPQPTKPAEPEFLTVRLENGASLWAAQAEALRSHYGVKPSNAQVRDYLEKALHANDFVTMAEADRYEMIPGLMPPDLRGMKDSRKPGNFPPGEYVVANPAWGG